MKFRKTFHFLNHVEAEIEPLELSERLQALDLSDDIVVQLKLDKMAQAEQVVDFHDICQI